MQTKDLDTCGSAWVSICQENLRKQVPPTHPNARREKYLPIAYIATAAST